MGALSYKQILVILSIYINFILSVDSSVSRSESTKSQILSNLQQNLRQVETRRSDDDHNFAEDKRNIPRHLDEDVDEFDNDSSETDNSPMLTADGWERKSKPLRNIFMGIYKNYKSTYMGNKTAAEYRKSMQDGWNSEVTVLANQQKSPGSLLTPNPLMSSDDDHTTTANVYENAIANGVDAEQPNESMAEDKEQETTSKRSKPKRKKNKRKKNKGSIVKKDEPPLLYNYDGEYRYNIGPGVNVSLDMKTDVVSVNLDEDCLKEILLGSWVDANEGRGKKYEMISKILPLFILPFLIQSAIIPFLVSKLKLLLIKSILVGKLAIFLLVISAIKNNQKVATYEPAPAYWAAEPSRRSEIYNGYRVEGRPTSWVQ